MQRLKLLLILAAIGFSLNSCHRKNYPSKSRTAESSTNVSGSSAPDSATVAKPAIKRKPKVAIAKVITVNDAAAKKSVDGRLYYDVTGHRYWKNYKDGKYYLFNQGMYNDPDFQPPK